MGTIPNANPPQRSTSFTQTQLNYLKWRSDPITNTHIPRVKIIPKNQYSQKINYDRIVQQMLSKQQFIDTQNISKGTKDQILNQNFVVFFEQYICTAKDIENSLELAENLYVLQCMLDGYQQVFNAFGKCIVQNELCFVTYKGEIRCWINKNPSKNEFECQSAFSAPGVPYLARNQVLSSESAIVKRIIGSSYQISNRNIGYLLFHQQVKHFLSENILLNSSFTSVKRFINHYLYAHRILIQNRISVAKIRDILNGLKDARGEEENSSRLSFSQSDHSAVLSINQCQNSISEMKQQREFSHKKMHHHSASDDFSHFMENRQEKGVHQKQNIKEPTITSTLANSKATKIRSKQHEQNYYFLKASPSKHRKPKLERDTLCFGENQKKQKVSVKNHRKMSSLDDQNWAMCLTPPFSDNKQFSVQSCHQYQQNSHNCEGERQDERSQSEQVSLLSRQDSLDNKMPFDRQCHTIFQSYESIHSLQQNKPSTGYKGKLAKMGRTVKIFHLPTGTKFSYTNLMQPKTEEK